jgi:hypothetical protein
MRSGPPAGHQFGSPNSASAPNRFAARFVWLATVQADRDQACVCAMLLQHSKFDRRSLPKFANLPGWFVTYGTFLRAFPDVLSGYCVAA